MGMAGRLGLVVAVCLAQVSAGPAGGEPDFPDLPEFQLQQFPPQLRQQVEQALGSLAGTPRDPEANGQLGMLLQAFDEQQAAAILYQRAAHLKPSDYRWAYLRGITESVLGRYEAATAAFQEAVRLNPEYLPAQLKLGESLLYTQAASRSQEIFELILRQYPEGAEAQYGLGRALQAQGKLQDAVGPLQRACELFPRFGAAHYALALVFRDLGQRARAAEQLDLYQADRLGWPPREDPLMEIVRSLNLSATQLLKRAVALEQEGQIEASIALHEQALKTDRTLVQAHINLFSLFGRQGRMEKAEAHYRAALELSPNLAELHYNYGVLLTEREERDAAEKAFQRALEINPYYAEAHYNLGVLKEARGDLNSAARHYRMALENRPDYRLAHFQLGRLLVHEEKYGEAIEHFRKTLAGDEDEQTTGFLYALAAAYARSGDLTQALEYARQARDMAIEWKQDGLLAAIERDLQLIEKAQESR